MIKASIKKEILHRIKTTEKDYGVRVLYAIESGSRAWGFESPDSDYDVRFIYAHPKEWYVAVDLEEKRDVIEYDIVDEIDINGWDVRKALRLFRKSNPAIVEWIQSPIVYVDDNHFANNIRKLIDSIYSVEKGIYHYRSMAKSNYRSYFRAPVVPIKKYFYVLRPLLSIRWLQIHNKPAPIVFDKLKSLLIDDTVLYEEINKLLERKKNSNEKKTGPAIPVLNNFIENELKKLENYRETPQNRAADYSSLNVLFHDIVGI